MKKRTLVIMTSIVCSSLSAQNADFDENYQHELEQEQNNRSWNIQLENSDQLAKMEEAELVWKEGEKALLDISQFKISNQESLNVLIEDEEYILSSISSGTLKFSNSSYDSISEVTFIKEIALNNGSQNGLSAFKSYHIWYNLHSQKPVLMAKGVMQSAHGVFTEDLIYVEDPEHFNKEEVNLIKIEMFPNPASESIAISFQSANDGQVEITFDEIKGTRLFSKEANIDSGFNTIELNVSSYANGPYTLGIQGANGMIHSETIIIKH